MKLYIRNGSASELVLNDIGIRIPAKVGSDDGILEFDTVNHHNFLRADTGLYALMSTGTGSGDAAGFTYAQNSIYVSTDGTAGELKTALARPRAYARLLGYLEAGEMFYNNSSSGLVTETAQGAIDEIEGRVDTAESDISSIEGDISTIQGDISTIQGDISSIQSDITTIEGNISTIQLDITALDGRVDDLESLTAGWEWRPSCQALTSDIQFNVVGPIKIQREITIDITSAPTTSGNIGITLDSESEVLIAVLDSDTIEGVIDKIVAGSYSADYTVSKVDADTFKIVKSTGASISSVSMNHYSTGSTSNVNTAEGLVLPFTDDEGSQSIGISDLTDGKYVLFWHATTPSLWLSDGSVLTKQTGTEGINTGYTWVVEHDVYDTPAASENKSVWHFDGTSLVKICDVDWDNLGTITLQLAYENGNTIVTDAGSGNFSVSGTEAISLVSSGNNITIQTTFSSGNVEIDSGSSGQVDINNILQIASDTVTVADSAYLILPKNSSPTKTTAGAVVLDNATGIIYFYDGSRSKYISALRHEIQFSSEIADGMFLKIGSVRNGNIGYQIKSNMVITGIVIMQNGGNASKQFEIRKNNSTVLDTVTLSTSIYSAFDKNLNIDTDDYLQIFAKAEGIPSLNVTCFVELAYRKDI